MKSTTFTDTTLTCMEWVNDMISGSGSGHTVISIRDMPVVLLAYLGYIIQDSGTVWLVPTWLDRKWIGIDSPLIAFSTTEQMVETVADLANS